jgi:Tfp pilus assembly protein PilO
MITPMSDQAALIWVAVIVMIFVITMGAIAIWSKNQENRERARARHKHVGRRRPSLPAHPKTTSTLK